MQNRDAVVLASAFLVFLGLLLGNGVYSYDTVQAGVVHRYNKITGSVALCVKDRDCEVFVKR